MSLLKQIHRGRRLQPPRLLVYGTEGIGKSTIASQAPKPIFIPTEDGLDQIETDSFPLCHTLDDVMAALTALATEEHDYHTVVIDSLDWLERLIWDSICKKYGVTSIEKADGGFQRGYVHALTDWRKVIDALRSLREEKGMIVILLAHSKIEKYQDPETTAFDRYSPRLHKHASDLICAWCDAVLLATRELGAAKGDKSGGDRVLRCVGSPARVAKNRYHLPEMIPLSWSTLMGAMALSLSTRKEPTNAMG